MSSPYDPDEYIFKMPFASFIYPQMIPTETLSILHDINESLTPSKRLPIEILVQLKDEVHRPNMVWQDIRSTWTVPVTEDDLISSAWGESIASSDERTIPLAKASLDPNLMKYSILGDVPAFPDPGYRTSIGHFYYQISSADLLYRIRCFFPEVYIDPWDGYKGVWAAAVRHSQTGLGLAFSEHKGAASLRVDLNPGDSRMGFSRNRERTAEDSKKIEAFSEDVVKLLNTFIGTVYSTDGESQYAYFHPAAKVSRPVSNLRYTAVPYGILRERIEEKDKGPYRSWSPVSVSATDLLSPLSPFRSLLPYLKYDVDSRKIDLISGTTSLTEIISSALLYYRLLCQYRINSRENATIQGNSSDAPITHSVWQMEFIHRKNRNSRILFMDDRGVFDIRANEDAVQVVMNDILTLINSLCGDDCAHPYDGTVAGCVA